MSAAAGGSVSGPELSNGAVTRSFLVLAAVQAVVSVCQVWCDYSNNLVAAIQIRKAFVRSPTHPPTLPPQRQSPLALLPSFRLGSPCRWICPFVCKPRHPSREAPSGVSNRCRAGSTPGGSLRRLRCSLHCQRGRQRRLRQRRLPLWRVSLRVHPAALLALLTDPPARRRGPAAAYCPLCLWRPLRGWARLWPPGILWRMVCGPSFCRLLPVSSKGRTQRIEPRFPLSLGMGLLRCSASQ